MSFDGSRLSVPPGSPMIRAPPLAVLLFLPPVLSHRSLASVPRAGALVACALEPPAECKGKCHTEAKSVNGNSPRSQVFPL